MAHSHHDYSTGYGPVGPAPQEHNVVYTTLHFDTPWSYDNYVQAGGYSAWRRSLPRRWSRRPSSTWSRRPACEGAVARGSRRA